MNPELSADTVRYEVWCQGHVDYMQRLGGGRPAGPKYVVHTRREAERLLRQADWECQADPKAKHFIRVAHIDGPESAR